MNKTESWNAYAGAARLRYSTPIAEWKAVFPDARALEKFRTDVGGLCYPGTFGQSPWDEAFSVAYELHHGISESSARWYASQGDCPLVRGKLAILVAYGMALSLPAPARVYTVTMVPREEDFGTFTGAGSSVRAAMDDLRRNLESATCPFDDGFAEVFEESAAELIAGATEASHWDFSMPEEAYTITLS